MKSFKLNPAWIALGARIAVKLVKTPEEKLKRHREMKKMCRARLRAEKLGLPTDQFPKRIRKVKNG